MGIFDKLKKKKQAGPSQQPTAQPGPAAPPLFQPQQRGQAPLFSPPPQQFPPAGGVQPATAPQPVGFFGSGQQQVSSPAQAQAKQPLFRQQPRQQKRPAIPSFPKLSPPLPRPTPAPPRPSQPVPGQRMADAAAVKAAVQRQVAQPVKQPRQPIPVSPQPLFGAPASSQQASDSFQPEAGRTPNEVGHFFSELEEPPVRGSVPEESSLGLVPLEVEGETPAERPPAQPTQPVEPAAPPHSRGRDAMRGDQLLFVAVQDYVSVLDSLKEVGKSMKEFEKRTHSIDIIRKQTLGSCKSWQGHLDDIHRKLAYIDHVLFER